MKKFLLFAALTVVVFGNAFADTDGQYYEKVGEIGIQNLWSLDRVHQGKAWTDLPACNARARTAVMADDVIYVARSEEKAIILASGDTVSAAVIHRFDANTGEVMPDLDVTLDGEPYTRFLGVNSIGVDNFGHVWIAPYTSETSAGINIPFYQLDTETGELTLITTFIKGQESRTDYYDVIGDITREEAQCNIITPSANSAILFGWHCEQGDDVWEGFFEGDDYLDIINIYPESVTHWGYGPVARFCFDEEYNGDLFWIDGFNSVPILYDRSGTIVETFEVVPAEMWPETGTNGVAEFSLDERNFFVYSLYQYTGVDEKTQINHACQASICELGEGMSLDGIQQYWQIPADELGTLSDGGNRVHCFNVKYAEEDGEEVVYLFNFKCYNGMGVYKIGKGVECGVTPPPAYDPCDVNKDGSVNVTDVNLVVSDILTRTNSEDCDVDGSGEVSVTDVNLVVSYILTHQQ